MMGYIDLNNQSIKLHFVEFEGYNEWKISATTFDKSTNNSIVLLTRSTISQPNKGIFFSVDMKTLNTTELIEINGPLKYELNYDNPMIWNISTSKVYIGVTSSVFVVLEYDIVNGNLTNEWIIEPGFFSTIVESQGNISVSGAFYPSYSLDPSTGAYSPITPNSCLYTGQTWTDDVLFDLENNYVYSFYQVCAEKRNVLDVYDLSTRDRTQTKIDDMKNVDWINGYN